MYLDTSLLESSAINSVRQSKDTVRATLTDRLSRLFVLCYDFDPTAAGLGMRPLSRREGGAHNLEPLLLRSHGRERGLHGER